MNILQKPLKFLESIYQNVNNNDNNNQELEKKDTTEKNPIEQQHVILPDKNIQQEEIKENKPAENSRNNEKKKKQTTITSFISSPRTKVIRTTTPKKQQPESPGLGKKMKTTSIKKTSKKTTKEIEKKTVKQLQGFWKDFAEKQRLRSQEIPGRDIVTNNQVLSVSRTSNAGKPPELAKPTEDDVFLPLKIENNANLTSSDKPATISKFSNRDLLILKTKESKE